MEAVVTDDGKLAIPPELRKELGLDPGTVVDLRAIDGNLVGRKRGTQDLFEKWRGRGKLPNDMTVDEYLRMTRGADRG